MKKSALFLGLILLAGCSLSRSEDEIITLVEETDRPEPVIVQEVATVEETEFLTPTLPPEQPAQSVPAESVAVSPDGRVLELPAQKIYLDPNTMEMTLPDTNNESTGVENGWISYTRPISADGPQKPRVPQAVVTLQDIANPNHYAKCSATNLDCIKTYEGRGYRRVRGLPHFAGYRDVPLSSDYPVGGRWRNNNNIPRW